MLSRSKLGAVMRLAVIGFVALAALPALAQVSTPADLRAEALAARLPVHLGALLREGPQGGIAAYATPEGVVPVERLSVKLVALPGDWPTLTDLALLRDFVMTADPDFEPSPMAEQVMIAGLGFYCEALAHAEGEGAGRVEQATALCLTVIDSVQVNFDCQATIPADDTVQEMRLTPHPLALKRVESVLAALRSQ